MKYTTEIFIKKNVSVIIPSSLTTVSLNNFFKEKAIGLGIA